MNKQELAILERVKQEEISFIDLMFSDISGQLKCVTISPRELVNFSQLLRPWQVV
jgi:glutamine synthetase